MSDEKLMTGDVLLQLRGEVTAAYKEAYADEATRPAAFGIACRVIQDTMGCSLKVAAMLLNCWVAEIAIWESTKA